MIFFPPDIFLNASPVPLQQRKWLFFLFSPASLRSCLSPSLPWTLVFSRSLPFQMDFSLLPHPHPHAISFLPKYNPVNLCQSSSYSLAIFIYYFDQYNKITKWWGTRLPSADFFLGKIRGKVFKYPYITNPCPNYILLYRDDF